MLKIDQLGASKEISFTRAGTDNKDEITLFHIEKIRNSATCSLLFSAAFPSIMKLSEKSRIAVVELGKNTHSLFRFLQSCALDIEYSIRDYGSELDFSEGIAGSIQVTGETIEYRIISERDVIGLFQKKIIANIDIELNGKACSIECHTWNDFGSETRGSTEYPEQWKKEYSVSLSNGAQEVKLHLGYIAKYVRISIRGKTGYRVRKFSLTP